MIGFAELMLHVPGVEHSLVSSSLRDDGQTVDLRSKKCVVNEKTCVVGVDERARRMYSVNLQRASKR